MALEKEMVLKLFNRHAESAREFEHGYKHLPTMDVLRNGAASTTTDHRVANNWAGGKADPRKVTLRAVVPRTAALSIPAYGVNIQSEHEVVVVGTAWKGWDVWHGYAPTFKEVPLQKIA
jgi:hypothetical protein